MDDFRLLHEQLIKQNSEDIKALKEDLKGLPERFNSLEERVSELINGINDLLKRMEDKYQTKEVCNMCKLIEENRFKSMDEKYETLEQEIKKIKSAYERTILKILLLSVSVIISLASFILANFDRLLR